MSFGECSTSQLWPTSYHTAPTVFVIDYDSSVRQWFERVAGHEWRTRFFNSCEEFLVQPRSLLPGCLLLDLQLPDGGLELQARLADRRELPIIFTTAQVNIPMAVRAMKAGAVDVLTKPFSDDSLSSVIRGALERSRCCISEETELRGVRERYAALTCREREVMSLVVSGLLNKQIGARLGISEITVKAHRGKVMRKMAVDSLARLVGVAGNLGMTPFLRASHRLSAFEDEFFGERRVQLA
jgi:FixJ family two-component response regulator